MSRPATVQRYLARRTVQGPWRIQGDNGRNFAARRQGHGLARINRGRPGAGAVSVEDTDPLLAGWMPTPWFIPINCRPCVTILPKRQREEPCSPSVILSPMAPNSDRS